MLSLVVAGVALQVGAYTPDPRNGYEDYLKASEMSRDLDGYWNWDQYVLGGRAGTPPPKPEDVQENDPDLRVKERMTERFGGALKLVETGNQKAVYFPRKITPDTTFPEYGRFRYLARLAVVSSHVAFAHGRTDEGINTLIDGMRFGDRIGGEILISYLVGVAMQSIELVELSDRLPQLSLEDAEKLEAYADELTASRAFAESLRQEAKAAKAALGAVVTAPASVLGYEDKNTRGLFNDIGALSGAQREALQSSMAALIDQSVEAKIAVLSGPEDGWLEGFKNLPDLNDGSLAGRAFSLVEPAYDPAMQVLARQRTRARILKLTARAIEYKWRNGKLPDRIEQFASPEERHDPFSGADFMYRKDGQWFSITSRGFGQLHDISLGASLRDPTPEPGSP